MRHHKWVTYMYVQGWCTHTRRIIIIENFPNYRRAMKSICMHRSNLQYDAQLGNTPVGNELHSHWNSHSRGIHRSNLAVCCAMRHDLGFCVRCKLACTGAILQYDAQLGNTPVGNGLHSHWNSHSRGIHRSNLTVCCAM